MNQKIEFAWVCRNKQFNEIERVELTDQKLLQRVFPSWIVSDNCEVLAKIRPTGFHDINGDPSRKLWEGDVIKTRGEYRVICFNKTYGQWMGESEHSRLGLYLLLDAYGAKYAGNIFEHHDLVPWWKENN